MVHGPGLLATLWRAVRLCFRRPDCLILWPVLLFFILALLAVSGAGVVRPYFTCLSLALLLVPPAYSIFFSHVFASKSSYRSAVSVVMARAGPIAVIGLAGPAVTVAVVLFTGAASLAASLVESFLALPVAFVCFLVVLYLCGRVIVYPSVLALEDCTGPDAIRRAMTMTGRHSLRSLVLAVLVFGPIIAGCASLLMIMLAMLSYCGEESCVGGRGADIAGVVVLAALLYVPVALALQTSFYLGLREEEQIIEGSLL